MSTPNPNFYQKIGAALTPRRAASYQRGPQATPEDCLCTYLWDVALAESLLPTIHFLEVVYRNVLHSAIGKLHVEPLAGHANWLETDTGFLHPLDRTRVARAKDNLTLKKLPINEANLVDELSLGFWTSLLDTRYDQKWPRIIKTVFPHATNAERKRRDIQQQMDRVRNLRNSVFHNHPIWQWPNLAQVHAEMHTLLSWVSASASRMAKGTRPFPGGVRRGERRLFAQSAGTLRHAADASDRGGGLLHLKWRGWF